MHTWILTDDFPPLDGGVATWAAAVAQGFVERGHRVTVLARAREGLEQGASFRVVGVRGPSFARWGGAWMAASLWLRIQEGDRLIATTWPVASRLMHRCAAKGVVTHVVFHGSDVTRPALDAAAFHRVCRHATYRWTVSRYLRQCLADRGHSACVLPSPVAMPSLPERLAVSKQRWLYVARATPLKGGDRFLRLVAAAGVEATIIGDGPALFEWRSLAESLNILDRVRFAGRLSRQEVWREMGAHSLIALLPRTLEDGSGAEGLGLVLLEAMARGVPAVGCRTGGVPEAVGPGLILEDPDDVAASVAAIRRWWSPEIGPQSLSWIRQNHGIARTVTALARR